MPIRFHPIRRPRERQPERPRARCERGQQPYGHQRGFDCPRARWSTVRALLFPVAGSSVAEYDAPIGCVSRAARSARGLTGARTPGDPGERRMVPADSGVRGGAAGSARALVFVMTAGSALVAVAAGATPAVELGPGPEARPRVAAQAPAPAQEPAAVAARAVLDRYCVTCHNDRLRTGGLSLDTGAVDAADPSRHADVWEKVIAKLRTGAMPPPGRPRPDEGTYDAVASGLEADIDRAAAAGPDPGRTSTVHRLNRTEYRNAIRDLFALDLDVTPLLPGDETSDTGFDNNADVLSISTAQLERYLSAARTITRLATGLATDRPGIRDLRRAAAPAAGRAPERGPAARLAGRRGRPLSLPGRR